MMKPDDIRPFIDLVLQHQLEELELEEQGRRIRIRRGGPAPAAAAHAPAAPAAAAASPAAAPASAPAGTDAEAGLVTVTSPIVGTYFESPSPGAPEFVRAGDAVKAGQVLCIIEAMKLMNEIEAETPGVVVKKLVTNGQPVEFGQPLLLIRPRS